MRELVLDTETTGLDPKNGDRIVEIGVFELVNLFPSGRTYHVYIDPERSMPDDAYRIHGLSTEFLSGKPKFAEIAEEFLEFVGDGKLVIHNAQFDMGFINMELGRLEHEHIPNHQVIDTLMLARRKFPAGPNSLDALCARLGIDNSHRTKHGALLDAELLADVYVELKGGKQRQFALDNAGRVKQSVAESKGVARKRPTPLQTRLSEDDIQAHQRFVSTLGEDALWTRYLDRQNSGENQSS